MEKRKSGGFEMEPKIIQQGAEAVIMLNDNLIIKDRIKKSYRIREIDERIRRLRTKSETKLLNKASELIDSPKPIFTKEFNQIKMPFIKGKKLSEHLDNFPLKKQKQICKQIGRDIAKLHNANIIHGDLTTSNMILVEKGVPAHLSSQMDKNTSNKKFKRSSLTKSGTEPLISERSEPIIYFIDFGLGFISHKFEDRAVDIHLLRQALEAKHFKNWGALFEQVIRGYKTSKDADKTLNQLIKVEKRGRYKH